MSSETTLLDDFLSGDRSRILHATWTVIRSRDPSELDPLLPAVARIRQAVWKVELGGAIRSNWANFEGALAKLEGYRRGACWCEGYRASDQFEPDKERDAGHIRIIDTSEPGWSMTYEVECTICGRLFNVDQRDGHVQTWKWVPRGEKRKHSNA